MAVVQPCVDLVKTFLFDHELDPLICKRAPFNTNNEALISRDLWNQHICEVSILFAALLYLNFKIH